MLCLKTVTNNRHFPSFLLQAQGGINILGGQLGGQSLRNAPWELGTRFYSPEFGTNMFAGIGIGASGAKRSDGAGAAVPGDLAPLGFRMSTYRALLPAGKEANVSKRELTCDENRSREIGEGRKGRKSSHVYLGQSDYSHPRSKALLLTVPVSTA